ncbi:MAG: mechanosensitive ion channel [Cytophagales bacterium]|nr:mechanosensitive ion channel [Rhizobacter sp.]
MQQAWADLADSAWFTPSVAALVAVLAALIVHAVGRAVMMRVVRYSVLLGSVVHRLDKAAGFVLPVLALQIVWQGAADELRGIGPVRHWNGVLLIALVTWLATAAVRGLAEGVIKLHPYDVADNLHARRILTQTRVLSRTAMGVLLVAGLSFMLMTFPGVRQLGASLLASAGVAGLVIGLAAKSVFSNLIAGLQIALSQPIRIDDVLVVTGEWGRVEEITGSYVVMRLWDQRRLIVPLQWFIENPFENWTRQSADLLGTVMLWVDYTLPLEPLRAEAQRVCDASPDWDHRVCTVQVTDANERSMQLRVLVSSASSGQNFDLRCQLREALIAFIAREHPTALPRLRAEVDGLRSEAASRDNASGGLPTAR